MDKACKEALDRLAVFVSATALDTIRAHITQLTARCEAAEADARRGRHAVEYSGWSRNDGKTYMTIPVADGADLSCIAFRRDALDAAIAATRHTQHQAAVKESLTTQNPATRPDGQGVGL